MRKTTFRVWIAAFLLTLSVTSCGKPQENSQKLPDPGKTPQATSVIHLGNTSHAPAVLYQGNTPQATTALQQVQIPQLRLIQNIEDLEQWYGNSRAEMVIIPLSLIEGISIHHFGYEGRYMANQLPDNPYAFLSNYYENRDLFYVQYRELRFFSSEAAYQAQKFSRSPSQQAHVATLTADAARNYARTHAPGVRVQDRVMREIVEEKFRNPILSQQLLSLNSQYRFLIEETTAWGDIRWGMVRVTHSETGAEYLIGENKLGKILGDIRRNANH